MALAAAFSVGSAGGTQPYETYVTTVTANEPAAWFRFGDARGSEALADSSGSGAPTAANHGIVLGETGPFPGSKAGSLGGTGYATLSSDPLQGASAFSAEAWIDWSGGTPYNQPVFAIGSSTSDYMVLTPASSATKHLLQFEIHTPTGSISLSGKKTLASGTWSYVAVTETSAGTITLYLNGEVDGTPIEGAALSPASLGAGVSNSILGRSIGGEATLNGSLSNVAFYDKALSPAQILEHYDAGEFPVAGTSPTVTGTAREGSTLTASPQESSWTGLAPIKFTYQWQRCTSTACANIEKAGTKSTYTAANEDVGSTLQVVVTGKNSAGGGTATSAQTATVEGKPGSVSAPIVAGQAKVGQQLSVSEGTWRAFPAPSFSYQWESCKGSKCTAISGATQAHYRIESSLLGKALRATVKASNSLGEESAASAATATVTAGPPVNLEPPTISGTPREGQTLTGSKGVWAGSEPIKYVYSWQRCNVHGEECHTVESGETHTTYHLTAADVGSTIVLTVTASNSLEEVSSQSSPTARVTVIPPENTSPPTITGTARDGQTLSASTGTWSGTLPLEYSYQWERCNTGGGSCSNIEHATHASYSIGHEDVGSTLRVRVTASNGAGEASSASSATAVVAALAPSNTAPPRITGTPTDGDELSASTGSWEGTPALEYSYSWHRCLGASCEEIAGATGPTYKTGHADVGHTLKVVVTAKNVAGSASAESAASEPIEPAPPTSISPPTISGEAKAGSPLTAEAGTWEGTPPLEYSYEWESCNAVGSGCLPIPGATTSTYTPQASESGDTLRVTVTAANAAGRREATSSTVGPVTASAPENEYPPTLEGEAVEGKTLSLTTGTWRGAEPISYTYAWERCLSGIGGSGSGAGQLNRPGGLAIDHEGNLLVADSENNRIEEFDKNGEYERQFGSSGEGALSDPDGVAVDGEGNIWVDDHGVSRIEEFNHEGHYLRAFGGAGAEPGQMSGPEGIAIDSHGHVWVSDTYNARVEEFTNTGELLRIVGTAGAGKLSEPEGLAIASDGDVLVTDWAKSEVLEYNEDGEYEQSIGAEGTEPGQFEQPFGITLDSAGDIWVESVGSNRVEEFDRTGKYLSEFGSTGYEEGQLELSFPTGLAFDSEGLLWVSDTGNNRLQQFKTDGETVSHRHCSPIAGATSSEYQLTGEDRGRQVVGVVTAHNGSGEASARSNPSATVTGEAEESERPVPIFAPSISGEARDGQTLTASTGTWSGTEPIEYSYQWELCAAECDPVSGATGETFTLTSEDVSHTVRVTVTATNVAGSAESSSEQTAAVSATKPEDATPPEIHGVTRDGETLTATTGTWSGTTPISYSYRWQTCDTAGESCSDLAGETGASLTLTHEDVGETIRVIVTASNAGGEASAASSPTATIEPLAPRNIVRPVISGSDREGDELTVSSGEWEGTPPVTYSYLWERCNDEGEGCEPIPGGESATITATGEDVGQVLRADVTAANGAGDTTAVALVNATAPSNLTTPYVLGEAKVGATLTAINGAWAGTLPLQYDYQWESCDSGGEHCETLTGATESTYVPPPGDAKRTIRVTVTAVGLESAVEATSTPTPPVANPLANTGAPSISGTPQPGHALHLDPGAWTGEPTIAYSFQWERCGESGECEPIAEATGTTYVATNADEGQSIRATVTAENSEASLTATTASTPVVGQKQPTNLTEPTIAGLTNAGQPLVASPGTWAGNGLNFTYQWEICNGSGRECSLLGEDTGAEVRVPYTIGSTLRVIVAAHNEFGSSAIVSAASQPIKHELTLIAQRLPAIDGAPQVGTALHGNLGTWAGTGSIAYSYQWESCSEPATHCSAIAGATSETYVPVAGEQGRYLRLAVTATDRYGPVTADSPSSAVVAAASAPAVETPPDVEGRTEEGQTLTADAGTWSAGSTPTYSYQWELCDEEGEACHPASGATQSTYTLGESAVGSTVRVSVTATTEGGSTTEVSAPSQLVHSTLASVAPPVITASADGDEYTATTGIWDTSGTVTYAYQWDRCQPAGDPCTPIEGATGNSYTLAAADTDGLTLRVTVTARQGNDSLVVRSVPSSPISRPERLWIAGASEVGATISAEGAPDGSAYQWELCETSGASCEDIVGATTSSYVVKSADVGHSIRATATPPGEHEAQSSAPFPVGPPTASSEDVKVEGATAPPTVGETVHVTTAAAAGSPPISETVHWERCTAPGGGCSSIVDGATYTIGTSDVAHYIRATVTYANGFGSTNVTTGATEAVAHSAPIALLSPKLEWAGSLQPGTTVTVNRGEWAGDDPIAFKYQWESCNAGGEECEPISEATTQTYALPEGEVGDTIRATVTAENGEGATTRTAGGEGYEVQGASGAPTNLAPPLIEGTPKEGVPLTATDGTWNNVPTGTTFDYQWLRCRSQRPTLESEADRYHEGRYCEPISGATSQTYTPTSTDVETTLIVEVSATNSLHLTGVATSSQSAEVGEGAPQDERAPTISGEAVAGNTITASKGRWTSEYAETIYQWQLCSGSGTECTDIPGATGTGYLIPVKDVGDTVLLQVTVETEGGATTASSAATSPIGAAKAPEDTGGPTITGTAKDGETLTGTAGIWKGTPEIAYSYQWERCTATELTTCTAIPGATELKYTIQRGDVHDYLTLKVTAENVAGRATAQSPFAGAVSPASAPKSLTAPSLHVSGTAEFGSPITLVAGKWSGDPELAYQWERCDPTVIDPETHEPSCSAIANAQGPLYTPGVEDLGLEIRVTETATNAAGNAVKSSEPTAAIALNQTNNEGASYAGVIAEGHTITVTSTFATVPVLPATTTTTYTFADVRGDETTVVQSGESPEYHLTASDVGAVIQITVHTRVLAPANGSTLAQNEETLETPAIRGTLTDRTTPALSGLFDAESVVSASTGTWATGRSVEYSYQWQSCNEDGENCTPIPGATAEDYVPTALEIGKRVRAQVTADDGVNLGIAVTAPSPVLSQAQGPQNTTPPSLSTMSVREGEPITLQAGTWEDEEGLELEYLWKICFPNGLECTTVAGTSGNTFTPGPGEAGATIQGEVVATTKEGETIARTAATEAVQPGAIPVNVGLPTISIIGPHTTEAILVAAGGSWENTAAGNSSEEIAFQWERCDSSGSHCEAIEGAHGTLYDANAADSGDTLRVTVVAENGAGEARATSETTPVLAQSTGSAQSAIAYAGDEQLMIQTQGSAASAHPIATCADVESITGEANCVFGHPAISPNGQMVAAEVRPASAGSGCTGLSICPEQDNSPDARIVVMNYDGSELRALPEQGGQPAWSPDGTALLDVHTGETLGGQESQLQTVDLASPEQATTLPLPEGTDSAQSPSYAANGARIAFVARSAATDQWNIYIANSSGAEPAELHFPEVTDPDEPLIRSYGRREERIVFSAVPEGEGASSEYEGTRPRAIYVGNEGEEGEEPVATRLSPVGEVDYSAPRLRISPEELLVTEATPEEGHLSRHALKLNFRGETSAESTSGPAAQAAPVAPNQLYGAEETPTGPAGPLVREAIRPDVTGGEPTASAASSEIYGKLAREFLPYMATDISDGFAPVDLEWGLRQRQIGNPYNTTKRCVEAHGKVKASCRTAGYPLLEDTGSYEYLSYPAGEVVSDEWMTTDNTIYEYIPRTGFPSWENFYGQLGYDERHPDAQFNPNVLMTYYLLSHRDKHLTIDYWYYYTFNYANGGGAHATKEHCEQSESPSRIKEFKNDCSTFLHDLHEGDWENFEVVLNQNAIGPVGTNYTVREVYGSRHGGMYKMSLGDVQLTGGNKHAFIYSAHGSHAIYPWCTNTEKLYPIQEILGYALAYDYVCSHHFSRRPWKEKAELGPVLFGGSTMRVENLAEIGGLDDKGRFACWSGVFGAQKSEIAASPRAPLQQLDGALEESDSICGRRADS